MHGHFSLHLPIQHTFPPLKKKTFDPYIRHLFELMQHCEDNGHHHRGARGIRHPHRQERRHHEQPGHQFFVTAADGFHDDKGDAHVEVAVLDGDGEHEAAYEDHYRVVHVAAAGLAGAEDTEGWEEDERQEGGDGQG